MSKSVLVRLLVSCALAVLLLAMSATAARAADTPDQSQTNTSGGYSGLAGPTYNPFGFGDDPQSDAQTFTPPSPANSTG